MSGLGKYFGLGNSQEGNNSAQRNMDFEDRTAARRMLEAEAAMIKGTPVVGAPKVGGSL